MMNLWVQMYLQWRVACYMLVTDRNTVMQFVDPRAVKTLPNVPGC